MPKAAVNGVSLYYEVTGSGPPVVLAHGIVCGIRSWDRQVERLASDYRVIAYDARGHGISEAPSEPSAYSRSIFVEDLRALMVHLGANRASIVGHSMGGYTALSFAIAHPGMVSRLVLADTGVGSDDPAAARKTWEAAADLLEQRGIEAFVELVVKAPLCASYVAQGHECERALRSFAMRNPARGLAHTGRHVVAARPPIYSLETQLRELRVPTLLIVGALDEGCVKPHAFMAATIKDAKATTLGAAGHFSNLEAPEAFNRALIEFLAS
jgi:pimeloyl-ACP methyl ester carboxylesterase